MVELFSFSIGFLLLDQWSKAAAQTRAVPTGGSCGGILQIRYVPHAKALYQRKYARAAMILVWLAAMASAVLLRRSGVWFQSPVATIGLGCALGGAAGNLHDILRRRYVIDFIDLGWWPVFNLADIGIIAGLALAFVF